MIPPVSFAMSSNAQFPFFNSSCGADLGKDAFESNPTDPQVRNRKWAWLSDSRTRLLLSQTQ